MTKHSVLISNNNIYPRPHPKQPEIAIHTEEDLLFHDGPIVTGRVVTFPENIKEEAMYELCYHLIDPDLKPGDMMEVRWTKDDLRHMLLELERIEKERDKNSEQLRQPSRNEEYFDDFGKPTE